MDIKIEREIQAAATIFYHLRECVFKNRDIFLKTKVAVYKDVLLPTHLYGCESRERERHEKRGVGMEQELN